MTEEAAHKLTIGQSVSVKLPGEKSRNATVQCIDAWRNHLGVVVGAYRESRGTYYELPYSKVQLNHE